MREQRKWNEWVILGFIAFSVLVAATLELYWLVYHGEMRQRNDLLAWLISFYWDTDRTYRDPGMDNAVAFTYGLESLNVVVWQPLSIWLAWAIWTRKPYRHVLQLIVACCMGYGTVLYFWVGHLSGYSTMAWRTAGTYAMFYGTNLPWLLGSAFLATDAVLALLHVLHPVVPRAAAPARPRLDFSDRSAWRPR